MERLPIYLEYNRDEAVSYAHKWALKRNPGFLDFEKYGGDCTNFASQVIFAGSKVMNYTPIYGWYYLNSNYRTPAWTGVDYLYSFLTGNKGMGPYGQEVDVKDVMIGDVVQLSFHGENHFNHSPVIIQTGLTPGIDNILIATHTDDHDYYPLTKYNWVNVRFIHILGVKGS